MTEEEGIKRASADLAKLIDESVLARCQEAQRLLDGGVNFYKTSSVGASSFASSTVSNTFLTLEDLQKAMKPIVEAISKPDDIAVWMKKNGCDPDVGWVLMVPPKDNVWSPFDPPPYVRISPVILEPCLIFAPSMSTPKLKPIEPLQYISDWRNP